MPTVEEYTDPYAASFIPVPSVRPGICSTCHSWSEALRDGGHHETCRSCRDTVAPIAAPVSPVVPISLVRVGSPFYDALRSYKDSPSPDTRATFALRLGALLARFLRDHGDCVRAAAGADWDVITIVPSSGGRAGHHPLEDVVGKARAQRALYQPLLELTRVVALEHRRADERAYRLTSDVVGARVLLIDDTFTTGSRVHSAGAALTSGGADVVASGAPSTRPSAPKRPSSGRSNGRSSSRSRAAASNRRLDLGASVGEWPPALSPGRCHVAI